MNSTMTTIVPGYYNASNTTGDDGPYECGQKIGTCNLPYFITYGVFANLICLFGIFGNTISMIVLSRPQMKSSINYLLIGLAGSDTMLNIGAILIYGLSGLYTCKGLLFYYNSIILPKIITFLYPLMCMARIATVYLTLAVTVERYIAVCHPLKARSVCTYGRAQVAVLVITAFAFLYNLSKFWEIEIHDEIHWKYNITVYCIDSTQLRNNEYYVTIYINWLYLFVYSVFPFIALVIFNTVIYRRVRKANMDLQKLSRHQRSEIRLAIMLLCIVIVFLICNTLPFMSNIYETFTKGPPWWMVMYGNLLVIINSSINFIIYIIFGHTFKKTFLKLFCLSWQQQHEPKRESTDSQTTNVSIASTNNIELTNSVSHSNYPNCSNTINSNNNLAHDNVHVSNGDTRQSVKLSRPINSEPYIYYPARSLSQMSRASKDHNDWGSKKRNHHSTL